MKRVICSTTELSWWRERSGLTFQRMSLFVSSSTSSFCWLLALFHCCRISQTGSVDWSTEADLHFLCCGVYRLSFNLQLHLLCKCYQSLACQSPRESTELVIRWLRQRLSCWPVSVISSDEPPVSISLDLSVFLIRFKIFLCIFSALLPLNLLQ